MRRRRLAVLAAVAATGLIQSSHAANQYTWVPPGAGNFSWSDSTNWTSSTSTTFPQAVSDGALIQPGAAGAVNIVLPSTVSVGSLSLGNSANAQLIDVGANGSGAGTLTLQNGTNANTVTLISTGVAGATNTISAPMVLGYGTGTNATISFGASSTNSLNLNGTIQANTSAATATFTFQNNVTTPGVMLNINGVIKTYNVGSTSTARTVNFVGTETSSTSYTTTVVNASMDRGSNVGAFLLTSPANATGGFTRFVFNASQSFTAGTTINKATVVVGNNNALGTGVVTTSNNNNANWGAEIQSDNDSVDLVNNILMGNSAVFGGNNSLTIGGWVSQGNGRAVGSNIAAGKTLTLAGDAPANTAHVAIACSNNGAADGPRTFTIDGPGTTIISGRVINNNVDDTIVGTLTFRGTGVRDLNNVSNTYRGNTNVNGGLLHVGALGALGNSPTVSVTQNAGIWFTPGSNSTDFNAFMGKIAITSSGALDLPASESATNFDFTATSSIPNMVNAATMSLGADGNVTYTGTVTPGINGYRWGGPNGVLTLPGTSQMTGANSVSYVNSGTVIVTGNNDYSGVTTIGSGSIATAQGGIAGKNAASTTNVNITQPTTLQVSNLVPAGAPSVLGASSNAAANLVLAGGILRYVGGGSSTDRLFSIGTLGGTIDSSGTGALQFTNTAGQSIAAGPGARTLTLTGTDADLNTLSSPLADTPGTSTLSVAKTGTGVWVLGDSNTYAGATTISGGTLVLNTIGNGGVVAGTSLGSSSNGIGNLVLDGGALKYVGGTGVTDRRFTVSVNGATIDASGTGSLEFLNTGSTNTSGSGARTLALTGTSTDANTMAVNLLNAATGTMSLSKTGPGTWVLAASNTFTGTTTISAGTLKLANADALRNSVLVVGSDLPVIDGAITTLDLGGLSGSTDFALSNINLSLGNGATASPTYSGKLTGVTNLTKSGTNTQTLSGNNTVSGVVHLQGGNLAISSDSNISGTATPINFEGGLLQINGTGITSINSHPVNWSTFNGGFNIADPTNTFTVDQVLSNTGSFTKAGSGILLLTASNSYTGGTVLQGGELAISTDDNIGGASSSITFSGGILKTNAGSAIQNLDSHTVNWSTFNGGFDIADPNNTFTVNPQIDGSGSLTKLGSGTLILGNGGNDFTGGVTLNGGHLVINNSALGTEAGTLTIGNGTLVFNGSVNSASRKVVLNGAATVDSNNNDGTFGGVISGTGSLTKIGAGSLSLTNGNAFTGGVNVNAGVLRLANATSAGNESGTLTFNGGTVATTGGFTTVRPIVLASSGTWDSGTSSSTLNGLISGTGTLIKVGAGTLTLGATNTFSGGLNLQAGALAITADSNIDGPATAINFNGGLLQINGTTLTSIDSHAVNWSTFNGGFNINSASNSFLVDMQLSGTGSFTKAGAGTLTLTATNNDYTGGTVLQGGNLAISSDANIGGASSAITFAGGILQINGTAITNLDLHTVNWDTFNGGFNVAAANNTVTVPPTGVNINGTGSLTKLGAGTLVLNGNNTYTGGTNVNGGALQVSSNSNLGDDTASTLTFNGGTLVTSGSVTTTARAVVISGPGTWNSNGVDSVLNGVASGSGTLTKTGAGRLTLNASNTFTGSTVVKQGTVEVGSNDLTDMLTTSAGADIQTGGRVIFDYTDPTSAALVATIPGLLKTGYGLATKFSTGKIRSTTATNASLGLGYQDDGSSKLTVVATYYGDANLDGKVTTSDFTALATDFNATSGTTWSSGDFNYDGVVNSLDFNALASNFGATPLVLSGNVISAPALGALVPEPAALSLAGLLLLGGTRRRRTR